MNQLTAAALRGLYGAIVTGGLTLLTTYQQSADWGDAGVSAGVAALGYLIVRGGIEGALDQRRNDNGDVNASDVGAFSAPLPSPK